ncbi:sensor domain-containing diguanylate cyclase [Pseudoalteromonas sp. NC201]|uniref:sensor domain-containing diguanylate cyclase n=1 Tax=Pseudoalteromonas sp. NC201 TaxID=1514074 RepID=UPI000C7B7B21|nr:GGDEF domain-containing protein [Pseudoalteromonas sp. NC201]AUJ72456.1 Response regulator PleD [Pseudoalteromonas sp. NC201]
MSEVFPSKSDDADLITKLEDEVLALEIENHKLQQRLRENEYDRKALLDIQKLANVGTWRLNHLIYSVKMSDKLAAMLGIDGEAITQWDDFINALDPSAELAIKQQLHNVFVHGGSTTFEHVVTRADGSTLYVRHHCETLLNGIGQPLNSIGLMLDVTQDKVKAAQLEVLSNKDELTNLYNRRKMNQALHKETTECLTNGLPLSTIILDLDLFKQVNDRFGHHIGDEVLVRVSQEIQNSLRSTDIASRWGGEEFLILCPNTYLNDAQKVAERIRKAIEAIQLSCPHKITASFGVGSLQDGQDLSEMLKRVDSALYQAKKAGRNCIRVEPE